jgi:dipeptidyl aminopeptidase/acylaminoacyl peptidase
MLVQSYSENQIHRFTRQILLTVLLFILSAVFSLAQTSESPEYKLPPKAIADLVDAPPTPYVSIDPMYRWMLLQEYQSLKSIEEMAQPELRLAGIRFNPQNHGPSRGWYGTGLKLLEISSGEEYVIKNMPPQAKIRNISWSPNGEYIAFLTFRENGQDLWIIDVTEKSAKLLIKNKMTSVYGYPYSWLPDNKGLICKMLPEKMGEPPVKNTVPTGPVIQETSGKKAPARTYQDLLKTAYDEALFEYHFAAQVHRVALEGAATPIGKTGIIRRIDPSPDGKNILVEIVHKPFSYLVPAYRFPYLVEVWDLDGNLVKQIADRPLAEEIPIGFGAVPTGPRSFDWRSDVPATLYWAEAQDGGDPKAEAEIRDNIYTLPAPFTENPKLLISLQLRYSDVTWGTDNLALVSEWWWQDRRIRTWKINPSSDAADTTLLHDYSWQDRYNDPGNPLLRKLPNGHVALVTNQQKNTIYFVGDGGSPEGDQPFIDSYDLEKNEIKRMWRSEAPYYERPLNFLDISTLTMITRRESVTEPPNYYIRNLKNDKIRQITKFPHPTPQLKDVQKELIRYDRDDGVTMTATLYLPPEYKSGDGPLPLLMWAYPREFKSADAAGQVTTSPYRFVRVGWWASVLWLAAGYAVLDGPTMPIIGEGDEEPNDTYVKQLVASARAAADEVIRRGVAEEGRMAIGGHSYGAFMAANLLAHSDIFAAGIARSGAYNRTLTPFGFQAEERTLWEAPQVYFKMSPFMHAEKVNEPILLIHGKVDNNSGTFPMQSERFYNALKGHGATARLVMLPLESHGYRSRESIMHMLWEMSTWLDKYVRKTGE